MTFNLLTHPHPFVLKICETHHPHTRAATTSQKSSNSCPNWGSVGYYNNPCKSWRGCRGRSRRGRRTAARWRARAAPARGTRSRPPTEETLRSRWRSRSRRGFDVCDDVYSEMLLYWCFMWFFLDFNYWGSLDFFIVCTRYFY